MDSPKSPWTAFDTNCQYWTMMGWVEPPLAGDLLDLVGLRVLPEQKRHRISRRELHQEEDQKGHPDQYGYGPDKPATNHSKLQSHLRQRPVKPLERLVHMVPGDVEPPG